MIDLVGQKFGRLTVVNQNGKNKSRNYKWLSLLLEWSVLKQ